MPRPSLALYQRFARLRWPRSYVGKLLAVAFVGIHMPVLVFTVLLMRTVDMGTLAGQLLLAIVLATLGGLLVTIVAQRSLLAPILAASDALRAYATDRTRPDLPTHFTDDAGQLMADTQRTLTRLDELLRFKNRLLGLISHDVRTPLTSIRLASDTLRYELETDADPAMLRDLARSIDEAARYQLDLIDNLLTVARGDERELALLPTSVILQDVLDAVKSSMRFLARQKDITLEVRTSLPAGWSLYTDRSKLAQVLNNLVSNAIKFSPPETTVTLHAYQEDGALLLDVADEGTGIAPEDQVRLFEAYTRLDQPQVNRTQGFGLGLWISRTIVELMGGTLQVQSAVGEGSTFTLRLPPEALARSAEG